MQKFSGKCVSAQFFWEMCTTYKHINLPMSFFSGKCVSAQGINMSFFFSGKRVSARVMERQDWSLSREWSSVHSPFFTTPVLCICIFVFAYLQLYLCIFVFVYLYLYFGLVYALTLLVFQIIYILICTLLSGLVYTACILDHFFRNKTKKCTLSILHNTSFTLWTLQNEQYQKVSGPGPLVLQLR